MTEHHAPARTPEPPRWANSGIGMRDRRTRMECLRIAADTCSNQSDILARADAFVRYIEDGPSETLDARWICLRMASQSIEQPDDADEIMRMAASFENFVLRGNVPAPA